MRVLVTGGAGFIGSHIVERCIKKGFYTVILDNLSTGKEENIHQGAIFYKEDVRSERLKDILLQEKVEMVIHQAAQIDVQTSIKNPQYDASVNILGTINLLEACREAGVRKVVYASSAAVYGNPDYLPVDEGHPLKPQSGYGISKQVPEKYLRLYRELHGLDFTVLRYANVYGPRQDASGEGGVVAIFIDKLLKGETPTIYGDGEQTRDFIFVEDVARANLAALERGSGQVVNISTGVAVSVNQLFQMIKDCVGTETVPRYAPERPGDIKESFLAPLKAEEVLGWKAGIALQEGIRATVGYYRQN